MYSIREHNEAVRRRRFVMMRHLQTGCELRRAAAASRRCMTLAAT
jgi:hypothetical protein